MSKDIDGTLLFEPERGPRFAVYEYAGKFELHMIEPDGRTITSPMRLEADDLRKLGAALVELSDRLP